MRQIKDGCDKLWTLYSYNAKKLHHGHITDRIEKIKYGTSIIDKTPNFKMMKGLAQEPTHKSYKEHPQEIPQETYKRSTINYTASDFETPTVTCPKCGTQHDFDYPKCPNCKHKYNL
jgi:hypothetical protein